MLSAILISVLLTPCVFGVPEVSKSGLGNIIGTTVSYSIGSNMSAEVDVFKGVPYAMRLDMSQRFQYAQPKAEVADDHVINAANFGYSCPQRCAPIQEPAKEAYFGDTFGVYNTNEDCLTLNIYRPVPDSSDLTVSYPVMVWIHGGAFLSGAGSDYDGGTLAAYGGVIVITVNYRLGAFGFLSNGDDTPTNIGLDDQYLAIKWINDNIEAFGGDKNKITLAGSGAGAESITYHMLQNGKSAHFQRVIALSGVISEDKIVKNPSDVADVFIADVCTSDDTSLDCLREKDIEEILMGPVIDDDGSILKYFGPTATGEEMETVADLLESSMQAKNVDLMIGVTESDASAYIDYLKDIGEIDDGVSKTFFSEMEALIAGFYDDAAELVSVIISSSYTDWSNPESDAARLDELSELLTDWLYVKPATELSRSRTASGSRQTYYMVFDHKTASSEHASSEAMNSEMVPYIFGNPFQSGIGVLFSDEERELSLKMMDLVKKFVYYGNPSYDSEEKWDAYTTDEEYLHVTIDGSTIKERYQAEEMAAWLDTLPRLMENQQTIVEDARQVDVLGSILTTEEAEDVIASLVFAIIALFAFGILIGTILLALRKKQAVVYDMEGNAQKHEIPSPPIYTPPSTLQKPNAALMATPVMAATPTVDDHAADPLPDYNEHIYDNRPTVAEMHTTPLLEEDGAQRPMSFSTFSGTDSGVVNEDEQERPDSALAALDNLGYEDSP